MSDPDDPEPVPPWYNAMRAARWMQIDPRVAANMSIVWIEWALMADRAESDAYAFKQAKMMNPGMN